MISEVNLEIMLPLELATTPFLSALEVHVEVVSEKVGDGAIATIVAHVLPPAAVEPAKPVPILFVFSIDFLEEWHKSLLEGLLAVRCRDSGDGVDCCLKSGMVLGIELSLEVVEIDTEG